MWPKESPNEQVIRMQIEKLERALRSNNPHWQHQRSASGVVVSEHWALHLPGRRTDYDDV